MTLIGVMAIGIIVAVNPLTQIQKARDASRKSDLSQIQKALETYYNDFEQYPAVDTSTSNYRIIGVKADGSTGPLDWGYIGWAYMGTLPKDPSSSKNYVYYSPSCPPTCPAGQSYYIYASLDRGTSDSQACNGGAVCGNVPGGASCGTGAICNYGVSSPNVSP